jgi:hypothetical protein
VTNTVDSEQVDVEGVYLMIDKRGKKATRDEGQEPRPVDRRLSLGQAPEGS